MLKKEVAKADRKKLRLWSLDADRDEKVGFHMPGHNRGAYFSDSYARELLKRDTTELSCTEDLHDPGAVLTELMEDTASFYGSGASFFLTSGSTTGIHAMIASVFTEKSFFLLPRSVHVSVLSVFAMLRCPYAFISLESEENTPFLFPQLDTRSLQNALHQYPQTTDVLLTSPDYYGRSANLSELVRICHQRECRLLVDEAHGAHFSFAPDLFPQSALSAGADMAVQSLHKTLPALTMTSLLHIGKDAIRKERVNAERVFRSIRMFETSSPSLMLAASAEYAVDWMRNNGSEVYPRLFDSINRFFSKTEEFMGTQSFIKGDSQKKDFTRMVFVGGESGISGNILLDQLEKRGIYPEMADFSRIIFLISPWQKEKDFQALYSALSEIYSTADLKDHAASAMEMLWKKCQNTIPEKIYEPYEMVFREENSKRCTLIMSEGCINANPVIPYPPGIPILWPGEKIQSFHVHLLDEMERAGNRIYGVKEGYIEVFEK